MVTVLVEPLILKPDFATVTFKVPPLVKPLIGRVYVVPEAVIVPLFTPVTPSKVISLAERPVIAWLKVNVRVVVVCDVLPLAVTVLRVTLAA